MRTRHVLESIIFIKQMEMLRRPSVLIHITSCVGGILKVTLFIKII